MAAIFFKIVEGMPKIDKFLIKIAAKQENLWRIFQKAAYIIRS